MRHIVSFFLSSILVLSLGCGHRYRMQSDRLQSEGRTAQRAAFDGQLDIIWEDDFNGKPTGPLSIHKGVLAIPSSKRRVEFRATETGENLGRVRTKGIVHTDLLYDDSLVVFGVEPPRGRVVCFDLKHHKERWRFPQRAWAGVTVIDSNRAVVAAVSGKLSLLMIASGESQWTYECESRLSAPPVADDHLVYQLGDDGIVYAVALVDGEEAWRVELDDRVVAPVTVGPQLFAATVGGTIVALDPSGGREIWRTQLSAGAWTAPTLAGENVIVALASGEVVALRANDGAEVWRLDTEQAIRAKPVVVDGVVLVATMRGKLISLNVATGEMIAQRDLGSAINQSPVADGGRIFVATRKGDIVCLGAD